MKDFTMEIYLAIISIMSIVCLVLYGIDKNRAKKNKWRIKEATLLLCGVCGGALGALLGMKLFRHKTKHWYFWTVNAIALILQAVVFYFLFLR